MNDNSIYKGDDTAAFGATFLTIKVLNPDLFKISKLLFLVQQTNIKKVFTDPNYFQTEETILTVNFDSNETRQLNDINFGRLIAYDENGLQDTCVQSVKFQAQNGVICDAKCCC